jgi:hypothetical protein
MYHRDCPSCLAALPKYEALARGDRRLGDSSRLLLVEVPPYGSKSVRASENFRHARLSGQREWFVQTPVEIRLKDGKVIGASHDLPSIANNE